MKIENPKKNISALIESSIKKNRNANKILYFDLGLIGYDDAYRLQLEVFKLVKENYVPGVILLLEHCPVITIGNNKNRGNLLSSEAILKAKNIDLVQSNRGGDVTFHGPGQLVCYPIFNLENLGKDLGKFVYNLEQIIINVLNNYGIEGRRVTGIRGVFVNKNKIASVGLHVKKWITLHGFSFNVDVDLDYFKNIIACGLKDHTQTSLKKILDKKIPIIDVKELVLQNFSSVFNIKLCR
jgi:lipoyl(octanoyl) transferase